MKTRTKYDDLSFLPYIIADTICGREYKGEEWSLNARHTRTVEQVEALRQKMTKEQVDEFCKLADNRCKRAYEKRMDWFEKIVNARGNGGRDQLYVWISHWLSSFLVNPEKMRQDEARSEAEELIARGNRPDGPQVAPEGVASC